MHDATTLGRLHVDEAQSSVVVDMNEVGDLARAIVEPGRIGSDHRRHRPVESRCKSALGDPNSQRLLLFEGRASAALESTSAIRRDRFASDLGSNRLSAIGRRTAHARRLTCDRCLWPRTASPWPGAKGQTTGGATGSERRHIVVLRRPSVDVSNSMTRRPVRRVRAATRVAAQHHRAVDASRRLIFLDDRRPQPSSPRPDPAGAELAVNRAARSSIWSSKSAERQDRSRVWHRMRTPDPTVVCDVLSAFPSA